MPRDLFEERGIKIDRPHDLFEESDIEPLISKQDRIKKLLGNGRTPFDTVRDLGQGALTGLGEGGQFIASALTGGYAPKVDFDKLFSSVGSPNKSTAGEAEKIIGSFLPYAEFGGTAGLKGIGTTKGVASKGLNYLQPGKQAEQFRSTLGSGTSSENIENLGNRLQFAKKSAEGEALIPKNKLYDIEGETKIIPNEEESNYLSIKNLKKYFNSGLKEKHEIFKENPTLNNYDKLQSALDKEIRILKNKGKMRDTTGDVKFDKLKNIRKALLKDADKFSDTLPENLKGLERQFRSTWRTEVSPYESKGVIEKLSSGGHSEVTPEQIGKTFTRLNENSKKVLGDLGSSAGKNILYNALQKVKPNDAEGLAKTLLELKRTKGYDKFVDKKMEDWANLTIKNVRNANAIKKALAVTAGASAGGYIGGPVGATVGAIAPFAGEGLKYLAKYIKR